MLFREILLLLQQLLLSLLLSSLLLLLLLLLFSVSTVIKRGMDIQKDTRPTTVWYTKRQFSYNCNFTLYPNGDAINDG